MISSLAEFNAISRFFVIQFEFCVLCVLYRLSSRPSWRRMEFRRLQSHYYFSIILQLAYANAHNYDLAFFADETKNDPALHAIRSIILRLGDPTTGYAVRTDSVLSAYIEVQSPTILYSNLGFRCIFRLQLLSINKSEAHGRFDN